MTKEKFETLCAIAQDVLHIMRLRGITYHYDPIIRMRECANDKLLVHLRQLNRYTETDTSLRFWIGADGRVNLDRLYNRLKEWA